MLMGYLLKEALKTLCGVNQWSYAVFWKFGCQNPKLLIWEEYYCDTISYSGSPRTFGTMNSEPGFDNWDAGWASAEASTSQLLAPAGNKVHSLVNRMMMENQLNVVGEGLVGRAAFTGNYQWILSEKYTGEAHPPQVLKEVLQQFSAGMQTVAVIPVLPHGVVQLGSHLPVMENPALVNDVKSLILQLGCVPGILLSDKYTAEEPAPKIGIPVHPGKSVSTVNSPPFIDGRNYQINSAPSGAGQLHDKPKFAGSTFQSSNMARDLGKSLDAPVPGIIGSLTNQNIPSVAGLLNGVAKAEVIHSDPDVWSGKASLYSSRSTFQQQSCISLLAANNNSSLRMLEQKILSDDAGYKYNNDNLKMSDGLVMSPLSTKPYLISSSHENAVITSSLDVKESYKDVNSHLQSAADPDSLQHTIRPFNSIPSIGPAGIGFQHDSSSKTEESLSHMMDSLTTNHLVSGHHSADNTSVQMVMKVGTENDLFRTISTPLPQHDEHIPDFAHDEEKLRYGTQITSLENSRYEDECLQHQSGEDLFDVLGVNFRNKMMNDRWSNYPNNGFDSNVQNFDKNKSASWTCQDAASDLYSVTHGNSESGIFSAAGPDHLLDAVISRVHPSSKQILDDNVSCKTSLTNMSSSSVPDTSSSSYGLAGVSGQMQGEVFGLPRCLSRAGSLGSCSFQSGSLKDNAGTYTQSSSIYGSQVSSWVEQTNDIKQSSSVSTAYSKKPEETGKTNRKRLKPGENPRPRPKDRQMIQDRVKELREIVPNGAKCSIDALLERTIKHMLFLQSVTKHADKLKQTGESKMFGKEGGLLHKDNLEGGATWAYEVGSQSMVCPIIVEDLNQPRQMLVEMLCEERGLFLEIADIIRGLGLTILKGVMETRNDKIWARFVVEANRDVTRMEIFISLVHLLEQTAKTGPTPTNGINNDYMMVHQFHQTNSMPAPNNPCGLQ